MPIQIRHLSEIPHLPLNVDGDVCRIVIGEPCSHREATVSTNAEPREEWIKEHCASTTVSEAYWDIASCEEVLDVRFSPEDLALYQRTFENVDGSSAVPGERCLLMRYTDYVEDVLQLAKARWGTDQSEQVRFPRLPDILPHETQLEVQKSHWQLLSRLRQVTNQWTKTSELIRKELQALAELNERLMQVEQWCVTEVAYIRQQQGRKSSPPLFPNGDFRLTDVWVEVIFALKQSDGEYDDDDDNFFWRLDRPVHGMQFDRAGRWNAPQDDEDEVESGDAPRGGYLFDKLRKFLGLDWRDMLRIGDVYADVKYRGTRVSPSLSSSDCIAYAPVTPYLWQDVAAARRARRWDLRGVADRPTLDEDVAASGWTSDLSDDEMAHCERINAELESIGFHIKGAIDAIGKPLGKREADPRDPLADYEIEVIHDYWLHPEDRVALARRDRLLVRQNSHNFKGRADQMFFDTETDWAEGVVRDQFDFRHCYPFHDLYDHHHISLKDLPRIDRICTKVEVWLQRFFLGSTASHMEVPIVATFGGQTQEHPGSPHPTQGSQNFYDSQITCTQCKHLTPAKRDKRGRLLKDSSLCNNHRQAELTTHKLAPAFTYVRQCCPGFSPSTSI